MIVSVRVDVHLAPWFSIATFYYKRACVAAIVVRVLWFMIVYKVGTSLGWRVAVAV